MLCLPVERPQFYEIYEQQALLGISLLFMFMAIDLLGGVFSILSPVFKRHVNVLAAVAYCLVVVRPHRLNLAFLSLTNVFVFGMPGL